MPADICFRVRDIPLYVSLNSLIQGILERFHENGDITIDQGRSTLVDCCYYPKTAQTAILQFGPKLPAALEKLRFGSTLTLALQLPERVEILIDQNFYGLTQLYTPSKDTKLDIIAVPGLNGHAYGSWAREADSEGCKKMWLRHFFANDRPECRTMIFGYNSRLSEPGIHTLSHYSTGLLEEIYKVQKGCEERPIALIGHSFGGIIIADAIVKDRQRRGSLFNMTKAIIFFGTPHRGLLLDDIVEMVGDGSPRLELVRDVERGPDHLKSFIKYAEEEHFRIMSFQETIQTKKVKENRLGKWARTGEFYTAVEKASSILSLPSNLEDVQSAEGDHSSLVKFDNPRNTAYTTLRERFGVLLDHIEQATGKSQAEINSKLRLAVSKNEHLLVSILLTLGHADPNAEDHDEYSIEGTTLHSPSKITKDPRMRKLLSIHGARIDTASTYPSYQLLMQSRGECDDPLGHLRTRPEDEFELNHSKRRGAENQPTTNPPGTKGLILAWLSSLEPEKDHDRIYRKRHESTGQWFLDSSAVRKWIGGPEMSLLWCYGKPGVGKSVLTSTLLEDINNRYKSDRTIGIAYIFFNFQVTLNQEPQDVLRIWTKQLCRKMDGLPEPLHALYNSCIDHDIQPGCSEIEGVFQQVLISFEQVFLIMDALDEYNKESRTGLVEYLVQLSNKSSCRIKLFIASRLEADIQRKIQSANFSIISVEVAKVDEDIARYVGYQLENRVHDHFSISKRLVEEIQTRLLRQSNGMFLWVKCQLDFIYEQPGEEEIRDALDSLPPTMEATYKRIMVGINDQNDATKMLAHRTLAWIITTKRPLTIEELLFAVSLKPPERPYYNGNYNRRYSEDAVLSSCRGLITNDCGTIRPIHFTVQEFLRARGLEPSKGVNASIFVTQSILVYLSSVKLRNYRGNTYSFIHLTPWVPLDLLKYACDFLGHHLHEAGNPLPACLLKFVKVLMQKRYQKIRAVILQICGNPGWLRIDQNILMQTGEELVLFHDGNGFSLSPLGLLSGFNLLPLYFQLYPNAVEKEELMAVFHDVVRGGSVSAVKALLDRGCDIKSRDSNGFLLLRTAVFSGCEPMVLFLLQEGADVYARSWNDNEADFVGYTVLHHMARALRIALERGAGRDGPFGGIKRSLLLTAAASGNAAVVKVLVEYGVDMRSVTGYSDALYIAVDEGNVGVVQALVDGGSNVNEICERRGDTLLCEAARRGDVETVKALIAAGADIEKDGPLYAAAAGGSERSPRVVEALLEAGAKVDPEIRVKGRGSALWVAATEGNPETAQIFLDAGAKVDDMDLNLLSPKSYALEQVASRGLVILVKALLDSGADGKAISIALYAAALDSGSVEVVQMLIDAGADVNYNIPGSDERNPALSCAALRGRTEIVKMLLDAKADINRQGTDGTALRIAADRGHIEIFRMLLDAGADVTTQRSKDQGTALHAAAQSCGPGAAEIVQLLVCAGADVNAEGGSHGSPLIAAAYTGSREIVEILLDAGADVNRRGAKGSCPLQISWTQGKTDVVQLLRASGAHDNINGKYYGPTLSYAARWNDMEMAKRLLDVGEGVDIPVQKYIDAIYIAAGKGHTEIVKTLLSPGAGVHMHMYIGAKEYGNALYHAALDGGYYRTIKVLLDHGVDINIQVEMYGIALCCAAGHGDIRTFDTLLDVGEDFNISSGAAYGTALYAVAAGGICHDICIDRCNQGDGHREIIEMLIAVGADVNAEGGEHGSALYAAIFYEKEEIVEILLEAGADFEILVDKHGTALHFAARNGRPGMVGILVDAGADVDMVGEDGTALQIAAGEGFLKTAKVLLEAGAGINVPGGKHGTALHLAIRNGHAEMVKTLIDAGADYEMSS